VGAAAAVEVRPFDLARIEARPVDAILGRGGGGCQGEPEHSQDKH
jgi:hypothetical protein